MFRKIRSHKHFLLIGLFTLALILGYTTKWAIDTYTTPSTSTLSEVRADSAALRFTNPLLFYKSLPDAKYDGLKNTINAYITSAKSRGDATDASVYFRDMNTGEWTGINEADTYEPASMLKVTTMLAYLKRSVEDPTILDKMLYYQPATNNEETYRAQDVLPAGYYSVTQLINWMIIYSDNDALASLLKADDGHTADVFSLFQLPTPTSTSTTPDYMSARTYSRVFRVLYDSTYLPWELSDKALQLLSLTTFTQGIVTGVPSGTVVSHKFGERTNVAPDGTTTNRELHDCGIVYKPGKPYFVCIMTKGAEFPKLQKIIADISALVYKAN